MSSNYYNNQLNSGINTIINSALKQVQFDETIVCTVLQANKDDDPLKYYVTNGKIKFDAYNTTDKTFKENEQVCVTIPKGDYGQKKLISSGYSDENTEGVKISLFENFIPVLKLKPTSGTNVCYIDQILYNPSSLGNLSLIKIDFTAGGDLWRSNEKKYFIIKLSLINREAEYIIVSEEQMFGNLENFYEDKIFSQSFLYEKNDFDINALKMFEYGWMYQSNLLQMIDDKNNMPFDYFLQDMDYDPSFCITFGYNKINTTIEQKLTLDCSGYRINSQYGDYVDRFNDLEYELKANTDKRAWVLTMSFMDENGQIYNEISPFELNEKWKSILLRYKFGATNIYEEPNWEVVQERFYSYNALIDFSQRENQFKVILIEVNGEGEIVYDIPKKEDGTPDVENKKIKQKIVSNPLIFKQKSFNDTIIKNEGLEFTFIAGSNVHNVYGLNNKKSSNSTYTIKADFLDNNKNIKQDLKVEWKIPKVKSMLRPLYTTEGDTIGERTQVLAEHWDEQNNYYVYTISSTEATLSELSFTYDIASEYNSSFTNNTIFCSVYKNNTGEIIEESVDTYFGNLNSNGTPMSFNIYADSKTPYFSLPEDEEEQMTFWVELRDDKGELIPLSNYVNKVTWLWRLKDGRYADLCANKNFIPMINENETLDTNTGKGVGTITLKRRVELLADSPNISKENILVAKLNNVALNLQNGDSTNSDHLNATLMDEIAIFEQSQDYSLINGPTSAVFSADRTKSSCLDEAFQAYTADNAEVTLKYEIEFPYEDNSQAKYNLPANIIKNEIKENGTLIKTEYKLRLAETLSTKPTPCNIIAKNENGDIVWRHPLLVTIDVYKSNILNGWNGSFEIDEKSNHLMAATLVAGTKDSANRFTGIFLGKNPDSDTDSSGLYGMYVKKAGETTVKIDENGDAYFSGTITAREGSNIAGWVTNENSFYKEIEAVEDGKTIKRKAFAQAGTSPDNAAFGVYTYIDGVKDQKFYVDYNGYLYAKNASIQGESTIGGWILDATTLTSKIVDGIRYQKAVGMAPGINTTDYSICKKDVVSIDPDKKPQEGLCFWAGAQYYANSTDKQGIKISGAPFRVYMNGKLYATNADISGRINANQGGNIGGWTIESNTLSSTGPFSGGYLKSFIRSYAGNQEVAAFGIYECDENGSINYDNKAHFPGRFYVLYDGAVLGKSYAINQYIETFSYYPEGHGPTAYRHVNRKANIFNNSIQFYDYEYDDYTKKTESFPRFTISIPNKTSLANGYPNRAIFSKAECHFEETLHANKGLEIKDVFSTGYGTIGLKEKTWTKPSDWKYPFNESQMVLSAQLASNSTPEYGAFMIGTDFTYPDNQTQVFWIRYNGEINTRGNIYLYDVQISTGSDGKKKVNMTRYSLLSALKYLNNQGWTAGIHQYDPKDL